MILPFAEQTPRIAEGVFIAEGAVVIGRVVIGTGSSVWYNAVLRGDVNDIVIGRDSNIQDGSVIHVDHNEDEGVWIGNSVTVGHGAIIHACRIDDAALIGMGATILNGAHIESEAMVAAGAVVTPGCRVARGMLYGGVPAKLLRPLTAEEIAHIHQSARNYRRYATEHQARKK